jgi:fibronectin-binding autotransporter adhesin
MKIRSVFRSSSLCLFATFIPGICHAGNLHYWNVDGTGGNGIWGTGLAEKNWNTAVGDPAGNIAWPDTLDSVAVFSDMIGGVVTVSDESLQAAGIIQSGANYIINAGTLTLVPDSAAVKPFIDVQAGVLTIDSVLAGSNGLIKSGGGTLVLNRPNTYSGTTQIENGTLRLMGSLASSSISISSGAALLNQSGGLSSNTTLTNAGSLTMNSNDTVNSYISNGGILTNAPGNLFSTTSALNTGSTVAGRLYADHITSSGTVAISGNVTGKSSTSVQSGTLNLTGTLTTTNLNIANGATLIQNGKIGSSPSFAITVVTNEGSLIVEESATVKSYISNGGLLDIRGGRLITQTVELNKDSTTKGGSFSANLITTFGAVRIENAALSARTVVTGGVLDLIGSLGTNNVEISHGASLLNQNSGLRSTATVTNAGALTLNSDDTIATYISHGGGLGAGTGILFTTNATLNTGSNIEGQLSTGMLTSNGTVHAGGTISANSIQIAGGTLTNTGTLGNVSTLLNINEGATLVAGGIQQYSQLTTTGAGRADWLGDLDNTSIIAPGGVGAVGILAVGGNFTQAPGGVLKMDVSASGNDILEITGSVGFDGTLNLNQAGAAIAPFVPVTLVSAAPDAYNGNIANLVENLDGAVLFNPENGTIIRIAPLAGAGDPFAGATGNQSLHLDFAL